LGKAIAVDHDRGMLHDRIGINDRGVAKNERHRLRLKVDVHLFGSGWRVTEGESVHQGENEQAEGWYKFADLLRTGPGGSEFTL
jgi:hypothetical protein